MEEAFSNACPIRSKTASEKASAKKVIEYLEFGMLAHGSYGSEELGLHSRNPRCHPNKMRLVGVVADRRSFRIESQGH